jgi:spore coat polysaccharide biosynthesis predicted glycosyltransferase SpsG
VVFHVTTGLGIGTGHVHRALTLARRMTGHEVLFVARPGEMLTRRLVEQGGFRLLPLDENPRDTFVRIQPDIVINDVLDTDRKFIRFLSQDVGAFVVNFEDVGPGSREADLTFNAMYRSREAPHAFSGPLFECLREEFYRTPPRRIRPKLRKVLVTFGGTDPCDLTTRVLHALDRVDGDFAVTAVLGLGYRHERRLRALIPTLRHRIQIKRNVRSMSELMVAADLMVTSYGRTLFEAAATATPAIALAQNARELRHTFAHVRNGVVALGMGTRCSAARLRQVLRRVIGDSQERERLSTRLEAAGIRCGREIVVDLIFEQYRRSKDGRYSIGRHRYR